MDAHAAGPSSSSFPDSEDEDSPLANSEYLTRDEVLKRRARRLRRLAKCYRDHYWGLMGDVRIKHRDYVWKHGTDSYKHELDGDDGGVLADNANNSGGDVNCSGKLGFGGGSGFSRCSFPTCRSKAMALTNYCFAHILSDSKQVLYIRCQYPLKSGDDPILCGKTALKTTVPLCSTHTKQPELNVRKALRKGGVSVAASNKLATKFHLVLTEYVKLIQDKRRAALSKSIENDATGPNRT